MTPEKYAWLNEIIRAEEIMDETGIVDFDNTFNPERLLVSEALNFMQEIKQGLQDAVDFFNEMKPTPVGKIKIYDIAKTHADFMLFRNGYKLIFSLTRPGVISIRLHYMNSPHSETESVEIKWGAFNDFIWMHKGNPVKKENLIRHYLAKFIRESIR